MPYFWESPEHIPNRLVGIYDRERSIDRFTLIGGQRIAPPPTNIVVTFECPLAALKKYDNLLSDALLPLVNPRLRKLLTEHCPEDVQFLSCVIEGSDGTTSRDYQIINVTHCVAAVDHARSDYTFIMGTDSIGSFENLVLKPDCLGSHDIARMQEFHSNILVSDRLRAIFQQHKIKGVRLQGCPIKNAA